MYEGTNFDAMNEAIEKICVFLMYPLNSPIRSANFSQTTRNYAVVVIEAISAFVETSGNTFLKALVHSEDFVRIKNAFVAEHRKSIAVQTAGGVLGSVLKQRTKTAVHSEML